MSLPSEIRLHIYALFFHRFELIAYGSGAPFLTGISNLKILHCFTSFVESFMKSAERLSRSLQTRPKSSSADLGDN